MMIKYPKRDGGGGRALGFNSLGLQIFAKDNPFAGQPDSSFYALFDPGDYLRVLVEPDYKNFSFACDFFVPSGMTTGSSYLFALFGLSTMAIYIDNISSNRDFIWSVNNDFFENDTDPYIHGSGAFYWEYDVWNRVEWIVSGLRHVVKLNSSLWIDKTLTITDSFTFGNVEIGHPVPTNPDQLRIKNVKGTLLWGTAYSDTMATIPCVENDPIRVITTPYSNIRSYDPDNPTYKAV